MGKSHMGEWQLLALQLSELIFLPEGMVCPSLQKRVGEVSALSLCRGKERICTDTPCLLTATYFPGFMLPLVSMVLAGAVLPASPCLLLSPLNPSQEHFLAHHKYAGVLVMDKM